MPSATTKYSRESTSFDLIARKIGTRLREVYGRPESEPLPTEHVELLLRLRHKERDRSRAGHG